MDDNDSIVSIPLNDDALTDMNQSSGTWIVGGRLASGGKGMQNERLFRGSSSVDLTRVQLEIYVTPPNPETALSITTDDGNVVVSFETATGVNYVVEASHDLETWTARTTIVGSSNAEVFQEAAEGAATFYRVIGTVE